MVWPNIVDKIYYLLYLVWLNWSRLIRGQWIKPFELLQNLRHFCRILKQLGIRGQGEGLQIRARLAVHTHYTLSKFHYILFKCEVSSLVVGRTTERRVRVGVNRVFHAAATGWRWLRVGNAGGRQDAAADAAVIQHAGRHHRPHRLHHTERNTHPSLVVILLPSLGSWNSLPV